MTRDNVVVWWLRTDDAGVNLSRLETMLDSDEQARAARFHFQRDRLSYIAAHALGRILLSAHAGGDPTGWRFVTGDHGKPEVLSPHSEQRLRLNLSHTVGLAAAALTFDHDIGIDVEWLGREPITEPAQHFFAPAECAHLAAVAPGLTHEIFLTYWTLKEAYVKAIGKGMAQPLDSFAFKLDPPSIQFDSERAGNPAHWLFRRFQPTHDHVMALALRHPNPRAVTVSTIDASQEFLRQQT